MSEVRCQHGDELGDGEESCCRRFHAGSVDLNGGSADPANGSCLIAIIDERIAHALLSFLPAKEKIKNGHTYKYIWWRQTLSY